MPLTRLSPRPVAKEWGVDGIVAGERIGEIWFAPEGDPADGLLIKYLHTSAPLSIQVHPQAEPAQRLSKNEAWYILAAAPDAVIGIGPRRKIDRDRLRTAAIDGSIAGLVEWRPVRAGDFLYCPSGTIHCIGADISLIEVQENADVTYRLHDFGRARETHVERAVAAAILDLAPPTPPPDRLRRNREILVSSPAFTIERWRGAGAYLLHPSRRRPLTIVPLAAGARVGATDLAVQTIVSLDSEHRLDCGATAELLVTYPGRFAEAVREADVAVAPFMQRRIAQSDRHY